MIQHHLKKTKRWGDGCRLTLNSASEPVLPLWSKDIAYNANPNIYDVSNGNNKIRFRQVQSILKQWGKGKGKRFIQRLLNRLPSGLKSKLASAELERQERREAATQVTSRTEK